jgi:hypothetical protein
VRLIRPAYAKAYVRRNKNDPADAAAICEAVGRPSMRFVAVKTEQQQAAAGLHKVRGLLVKQRTMPMNQTRGLMAAPGLDPGVGIVAGKGTRHFGELLAVLAGPDDHRVPAPLRQPRHTPGIRRGRWGILQRPQHALHYSIERVGRKSAEAGQESRYRAVDIRWLNPNSAVVFRLISARRRGMLVRRRPTTAMRALRALSSQFAQSGLYLAR